MSNTIIIESGNLSAALDADFAAALGLEDWQRVTARRFWEIVAAYELYEKEKVTP